MVEVNILNNGKIAYKMWILVSDQTIFRKNIRKSEISQEADAP
jgi:hypothetical protein